MSKSKTNTVAPLIFADTFISVPAMKNFLQQYHPQLQEQRSFPPLGLQKALHTVAPLFGKENWQQLSALIGDCSRPAAERDTSTPPNLWDDDTEQFARLLAEIDMVGLTDEQKDGLCESMDLEHHELETLFVRAIQRHDVCKMKMAGAKPEQIQQRIQEDHDEVITITVDESGHEVGVDTFYDEKKAKKHLLALFTRLAKENRWTVKEFLELDSLILPFNECSEGAGSVDEVLACIIRDNDLGALPEVIHQLDDYNTIINIEITQKDFHTLYREGKHHIGYQPDCEKHESFYAEGKMASYELYGSLTNAMKAHPEIHQGDWIAYDFSGNDKPIEDPEFLD